MSVATDVEVKVLVVTPEMASDWLALNKGNRRVRWGVVEQYTRDMLAGRWGVTGDSVKLNGSQLLDGQHRLLACVKAGVPFRTVVAFGVDSANHAAIDAGAKRTMSDELRWLGEGDSATVSAALALLWRWRAGDIAGSPST